MNFCKIIFLGTLLGTVPLWADLSINDSGSFTVGNLHARFKCAAGAQWKSAIQDNLRYFTVVKREGDALELRRTRDIPQSMSPWICRRKRNVL